MDLAFEERGSLCLKRREIIHSFLGENYDVTLGWLLGKFFWMVGNKFHFIS